VNLLLLAIAFRAWSGTALSAYLRIMAAIATFSLEMQVATWTHAADIRSIRLVNVALAVLGVLWHARRPASAAEDDDAPGSAATSTLAVRFPPVAAAIALALVVATLALVRPVTGADPYHLHRVDQITSRGTLAYDPAALDIKVNALAGVYELLLADLRIPGMATAFVRLHGLLGMGLYLLALAAAVPWVPVHRRWLLLTFLTIPVVFHQLVLVKNDLFGAVPVFVSLVWVVARGRAMTLGEVAGAAALAGFAVGIKISSAPIALIVFGFVMSDHWRAWRMAGVALWSGLAGAAAGGLLFTLLENQLVYGTPLQPYFALGNRHEHIGDALVGVSRFVISLLDLGTVSTRIWPGRGGWGGTLGLPMIWAIAVLALNWRQRLVRRTLVAAGVAFLVFAASYPDADIAHRMIIGPGVLVILVALGCVDRPDRRAVVMRRLLVAVLAASALQILRSAVLYLRS
jgi:hypothetical protein